MVQLTDKHWAIPIPDNANGITIGNHYFGYYEGEPTFKAIRTMPLPGSWQFLFTTKEATGEDARKVVGDGEYADGVCGRYYKISESRMAIFKTDDPLIALTALIKSKGCDVNKNQAIIQKL